LQVKKCKKFNFFQNQNDTCAHLFTLVMKFHDRQSSVRCIRKLNSRRCLDKTRTRWKDFLFLITDDRDFRPQTCTNSLVFRECKHIKNLFEDVYFTKNSFHITLSCWYNLKHIFRNKYGFILNIILDQNYHMMIHITTCSYHNNKEKPLSYVMCFHPYNFIFLSYPLNLRGHLIF
jgi:hypothetical protein